MSITLYPPVRAPTLDQELLAEAGARVHPTQYKTHDFSARFQSIYGRPTSTYHAWARLWTMPTRGGVLAGAAPAATANFLVFAGHGGRFVEFCVGVDARGAGRPVGRGEMEGAWVRVLVGMFEEMRGGRERMRAFVGRRVGRGKGRLLMTIREVEAEMRVVLRSAVEQRFGRDAEAYWERKWRVHGLRYPDLDVKRVTDWAVEAPFQKSLLKPEDVNDDDYDETGDEHEHEHEDGNRNEDRGERGGEKNDSAVAMDSIETTQEVTWNCRREKMQGATAEDSDAKQNMEEKAGVKLPTEGETAGTRETLKQEMRLEESDGMHGSLAFSD
ncbi:hypothetical protein MFRU_003g01300 [Monilinia fructicola]|nr:hypothetical protein MFRU_003g01300 [Monilinia fructicola]